MTIPYNEERLEAFQTMAAPGPWKGPKPHAWVASVGLPALASDLWSQDITRAHLKSACIDAQIPDRDLLWGILSWGRMRRDAARRLARNEAVWVDLVHLFRQGHMSRAACFSACVAAIQDHPGGGIGPAYFTKLIFFANPEHDGYIMDQWTARSVNFLVPGPRVVRMRTSNHVDPRNSAEDYEKFCQIVEDLSRYLVGRTPEETEMCLFSKGHPDPAPWRRYLLKNGG